jgi:hypothetical protein
MKSNKNLCLSHFKALQDEWYAKLKKKGFEDIEDTDSPQQYLKSWHSQYFQVKYTATTFEAKQEYYQMALSFLNDHRFANRKEKEIWKLHTDGLSLRKIASTLNAKKIQSLKTHKDGVNKIIAELAKKMMSSKKEEAEEDEREPRQNPSDLAS